MVMIYFFSHKSYIEKSRIYSVTVIISEKNAEVSIWYEL